MDNKALSVISPEDSALAAEAATVGDLSALTPEKRTALYGAICRSVGLNPLTKPFEYIRLNGKLTLYALKGATDQLRKVNGVSIVRVDKELVNGILMVTAHAQDASGRMDSDIGAVPIGNLQGEALANAHMKAITKAKRRVTLSISGLGWLDETEVDTIPSARPAPEFNREIPTATVEQIDQDTGEITAAEAEATLVDREYAANELSQALENNGFTEDDLAVYFDRAGIDPETVAVERLMSIAHGLGKNPVAFGETVEKHRLQMQVSRDPELMNIEEG